MSTGTALRFMRLNYFLINSDINVIILIKIRINRTLMLHCHLNSFAVGL